MFFSAGLKALTEWRRGTPLGSIPLPADSRRLLTDLLTTLFRRLAVLDWMIDQRLKRGKIKPKMRDLLRLGLCSSLYHDGIHEGVAVDSCVRLAKRISGHRMGGMINGIMREALRQGPPDKETPGLSAHILLNLSPELYAAWKHWMDNEQMETICQWIDRPAPLTVRARKGCPDPLPPEFADILIPIPAPALGRRPQVMELPAASQFFPA